nr:YisL family protein [Lysinibacillus timonensis]
MGFLTASTHLHITTWVIAIVLFLIAAFASKSKGIHMALRLFYILIIITGVALFITMMGSGMGMQYGIKFILGILVIGMMEMILVKQAKNKPTGVYWVLFAIFLFATLYFGFSLPMGFRLF